MHPRGPDGIGRRAVLLAQAVQRIEAGVPEVPVRDQVPFPDADPRGLVRHLDALGEGLELGRAGGDEVFQVGTFVRQRLLDRLGLGDVLDDALHALGGTVRREVEAPLGPDPVFGPVRPDDRVFIRVIGVLLQRPAGRPLDVRAVLRMDRLDEAVPTGRGARRNPEQNAAPV